MAKYRVVVSCEINCEPVSVRSLERAIKSEWFLESGLDVIFDPKTNDSIDVRYQKFDVSVREIE